ncbi:RNA polymerase sigma-70 factor [Phocaeicola sp.]
MKYYSVICPIMSEYTNNKYEFEQLYKGNYARLYYYAFQFISDAETCKDIVNDVFEKTWNLYESLQQETITAYLYANVRNKCIDHLRHSLVKEQYAEFYKAVTQEEADNGFGEREERIARIEKVIEELTDPTQTILKECYYENKKYQEVADEFGMSINGVKKHIRKALLLIREEFGVKKKSREVPGSKDETYI